jgi:hypothetical protein
MRQLFFILFASAVVLSLSNCNAGEDAPPYTIPRDTAYAMYAHYMDSIVDKSDSVIIRQIFPSVSKLNDVLKIKNLTGIKFMIAAYLDTDPVVARRNKPMVIMQLKTEKGGKVNYYYYDMDPALRDAAKPPPYCPPPNACSIEEG